MAGIRELNEQLSSQSSEQERVLQTFQASMAEVCDAIRATARGAEQTAAAGEELEQLSLQMDQLVGHFKVEPKR